MSVVIPLGDGSCRSSSLKARENAQGPEVHDYEIYTHGPGRPVEPEYESTSYKGLASAIQEHSLEHADPYPGKHYCPEKGPEAEYDQRWILPQDLARQLYDPHGPSHSIPSSIRHPNPQGRHEHGYNTGPPHSLILTRVSSPLPLIRLYHWP